MTEGANRQGKYIFLSIVCILILGSILYFNNRIADEIQRTDSTPIVSPAQISSQAQGVSQAVVPEKLKAEMEDAGKQEATEMPLKTVVPEAQKDQEEEVIYEKPLKDVILLQ